MKRRIITILLISIGLSGLSQSVRTISFKLESHSGQVIQQQYIYLEHADSIIARAMTYFDGRARLVFPYDPSSKDYYVVVRQSHECVSKVALNCFDKIGSKITMPMMSITLENDEFRSLGKNERIERFGQEYDGKFVFGNISTDIQNFFPLESLMYDTSGYYQAIENSSYYENFYRMIGHYPSKNEIDSIVSISRNQEANAMQKWFSYNLSLLQEPILYENQKKSVYRFSWFVNNGNHRLYEPYSIRVEIGSNGDKIVYISYRLWDDCGEYPLFCVITDLNNVLFDSFLEKINKMEFFGSPSLIEKNGSFDNGSTSILEASINGKYHVIFRGEGEDEGLEELRRFLWDLTGLGENKIVHKRQRIE